MQGCWPTPQEFDAYVSYFITPSFVAAAFWIFAAAVQALPDPDATSGKMYAFAYRFAHLVAGNTALARKPFQDASGRRHSTKPEAESV
jgi:hypothetical protein